MSLFNTIEGAPTETVEAHNKQGVRLGSVEMPLPRNMDELVAMVGSKRRVRDLVLASLRIQIQQKIRSGGKSRNGVLDEFVED